MTATTYLNLGRDVTGVSANAPQFSTVMYSSTLGAGVAASVAVPLDALAYIMVVKVQPTGWAWVSRTTTAAVPAGGTLAAIASEMVEGGTDEFRRLVYPKDTISVISANTTCDISIVFYAVGYP